MYMRQSELLEGLSKDFVNQVMEVAEKQTHKGGHILFKEGDRAKQIYILLEGRVSLTMGETSHTVYTVDQPGEVFGWSSLVGRKGFSTTAECKEPTKLLKISVQKLQVLFEKDQASEIIFFRHLAALMGARLIQSYKMISGAAQAEASLSYGTGQVQEAESSTS